MIANLPFIEQKFEEFNLQMFAGKLPKLPIELSRAYTFVGICVYKKKRKWLGGVECYDFKLRISNRFDLPQEELEDVIIHEMIHYYIGVNRLKDASAHGPLFRSLMSNINNRFHRHITISHKCTKEQRASLIDTRPKWHVVAIVSFADGKKGIKVLPRIAQRILRYNRLVKTAAGVVDVSFYLSKNPYFNQFPSSSALNVRFVEEKEFFPHLQGADVLMCKGNAVIGGSVKISS